MKPGAGAALPTATSASWRAQRGEQHEQHCGCREQAVADDDQDGRAASG